MSDNGSQNGGNGADLNDMSAIVDEIGAIKDGLRDLAKRTNAVQSAVKSHSGDLKKREKAVEQAVSGLKQLKELALT